MVEKGWRLLNAELASAPEKPEYTKSMTAHASTEPGERVPARTTRPRRRRVFIALGAIAILLVAVVVWRSRSQSSRSGASAAASAEARVVPVSVATVGKQDGPVSSEGS